MKPSGASSNPATAAPSCPTTASSTRHAGGTPWTRARLRTASLMLRSRATASPPVPPCPHAADIGCARRSSSRRRLASAASANQSMSAGATASSRVAISVSSGSPGPPGECRVVAQLPGPGGIPGSTLDPLEDLHQLRPLAVVPAFGGEPVEDAVLEGDLDRQARRDLLARPQSAGSRRGRRTRPRAISRCRPATSTRCRAAFWSRPGCRRTNRVTSASLGGKSMAMTAGKRSARALSRSPAPVYSMPRFAVAKKHTPSAGGRRPPLRSRRSGGCLGHPSGGGGC